MSNLGKIINTLRKEKGWSLKDLSNKTDIPVSTLHGIEKGSIPSFDRITKIADALEVSASDLLYPTDSEKAKAANEFQNIMKTAFYDTPAIEALEFLTGQTKDENIKEWFLNKIHNNQLNDKIIQNLVSELAKYLEYELYKISKNEK